MAEGRAQEKYAKGVQENSRSLKESFLTALCYRKIQRLHDDKIGLKGIAAEVSPMRACLLRCTCATECMHACTHEFLCHTHDCLVLRHVSARERRKMGVIRVLLSRSSHLTGALPLSLSLSRLLSAPPLPPSSALFTCMHLRVLVAGGLQYHGSAGRAMEANCAECLRALQGL